MRRTFVGHAVHDGHEALEPQAGLLLAALAHQLAQAGDHALHARASREPCNINRHARLTSMHIAYEYIHVYIQSGMRFLYIVEQRSATFFK